MAYTPTQWNTGDDVTATKLNKLEQGVANAGGGGNIFYEVTTTNFPSTNNTIGYFYYIKKTGNTYAPANMLSSTGDSMIVMGNRTGNWYTILCVPTLEDYYLGFYCNSGVSLVTSSGGISSTPVATGNGNAYIVTGDFTATFQGWQ